MAIKSAGTYMQISDLCKSCSKQNFCGNGMADHYCTGYAPCVETRWDIKVPPFTDGQKQLIEMTEKLAEKRGGKICDVDDDIDEEMKPCPFCGGEARTIPYSFEDIAVRCKECGCGTGIYDTEKEAIEAWNKRVVAE